MNQKVFIASVLAAGGVLAQQGGSPDRGAAIFAGKGACTSCHRVADKGSRLGVDLTEIGELRGREALEKALLEPAAEVQSGNRTYRVVTSDGTAHTGKLLNHDTASIQMLDSQEKLRSFPRSGVRESGFVETPRMPSYRNKLSAQEITDLVAYLSQLKGVTR